MFRIEYTDEFYCDYLACVKLLMINNTGGNATELIGIVSRGKFLPVNWYARVRFFQRKSWAKLEPVLLIEIENCFKKEAYKIVVALCESLFYIDPINDEALCYAIQSLTKMNILNEAKVQYLNSVSNIWIRWIQNILTHCGVYKSMMLSPSSFVVKADK